MLLSVWWTKYLNRPKMIDRGYLQNDLLPGIRNFMKE